MSLPFTFVIPCSLVIDAPVPLLLQKKKTTTIAVEVKKSQHKYVIGPKGNSLQEILEKTGVSVEIPPTDSSSETVILRGEPEKLGQALTEVYAKVLTAWTQTSFESPTKIHPWALTGGGGWSLSGCQRCSLELNKGGAAWELEVKFCESLFQSIHQTVSLSLRPTVLPSPRSQPPLGFIVSSLERKDKTWPK